MNIEPIIGIENAVAGGFFDWFKKKEDTQGYTNESWRTLKEYGNFPITQIVLARTPIGSAINTALNIITFGALDRAKKELSYDKLFHLQMVVSVKLPNGNTRQIVVEKNERVNISPGFQMYKTTETYPINIEGKNLTLNEMMSKTRQIMGQWFHQYDAFQSGGNCQYFIISVLTANGLNSRGATEFTFQNVNEIAKKLPGYTKPIARALTDIASWWSKLTGAGYMEGGGRFQGGRFIIGEEDEDEDKLEGSGLTGGELKEKIEEEIERPLTGDELLAEFPKSLGELKVILYGDMKGQAIDDVLDDEGRVVILYPGESPTNGHWVCLWKKGKDHYHFFDSYGDAPETQKRNIPKAVLREWGLEHPLLKLAIERQGGALTYNKIPFQEEHSSVNTCGRFCLCRLAMKELSDKQFEDLIKKSGVSADEFVSILTMPEAWEEEAEEIDEEDAEDDTDDEMEGGLITERSRGSRSNKQEEYYRQLLIERTIANRFMDGEISRNEREKAMNDARNPIYQETMKQIDDLKASTGETYEKLWGSAMAQYYQTEEGQMFKAQQEAESMANAERVGRQIREREWNKFASSNPALAGFINIGKAVSPVIVEGLKQAINMVPGMPEIAKKGLSAGLDLAGEVAQRTVIGGRLATPEEIARGDYVEVGIHKTKRYQDNSASGVAQRREQYEAEAPLRERREQELKRVQDKRVEEFGGFWGYGEKAWRSRERAKILGPLVRLMNTETLSEEDRLAGLVEFVDWMTTYYVARETPATSGQYDDLWIAINNISNPAWKSKLLGFLETMKQKDYIGEFWQQRIHEAEERRAREYQEAMERWRQENPVLAFVYGVSTGLGTWVNNTITKPLTNVANLILSNIPGLGQIYTKLGIGDFLKHAGENFGQSLDRASQSVADPTTNIMTQVGAELLSSAVAPVSKGIQALKTASDVADVIQS